MEIDKKYRWKIITILVLSVLVLLGLFYVHILRNRSGKPAAAAPTPAATATPEATPAPTPEPTPTPTPEPTPEPVTLDIDSDDSLYKLVNKNYTVSPSYVPSDLVLVDVRSDSPQYLRKEAADQLTRMFNDAIAQNIYFKLVSSYRDYNLQSDLEAWYINRDGKAQADRLDCHPGASEHQLGLAVDLGNWNNECELNACFTWYPTYTFLQEHAHEYGFIERYPDGSESITGILYSPWHWRYIGVEEATKIHNSGKTLEEYYGR